MRRALAVALGLLALVPAGAAASQLQTFALPSALVDPSSHGGVLERNRTAPRIHVLLPDGYDPKSKQGYPVLWLLHGANGGTDSWIPGITRLLPNFPGIMVMPDGGKIGMYVDWWNGGARGGPAWSRYHLQVLRREIDRRYAIRAGRRWHAIAGISMGGQGTLRYAAMLPGYFGSAAGFSAAFPNMQSAEVQFGIGLTGMANAAGPNAYAETFGPPGGFYVRGVSAQNLTPNYGHTRLYLTSGNGINCPQDPPNGAGFLLDTLTESAIHAQEAPFAAAARAAGADVTVVPTCGVHTFGVWDRAIPKARAWGFFEPVAERPATWEYRTVAREGEAWGFGFRFAAPPDRIVALRRRGDVLAIGPAGGPVTLTSPAGCTLGTPTPADVGLPLPCPPVTASVRPRRVRSGRRTRLTIRLRPALAGARVRVGKRSARTDARGIARVRVCLRGPGRRRVIVTAPERRPVVRRVRVVGRARCR